MQQWLNEPKNQPIVYGIAGVVMIASIVFILFRLQIIGAPAPYVPPVATANAPQNGVPSGAVPPSATPGAAPGVTPTAATPTATSPVAPVPGRPMPGAMAPGNRKMPSMAKEARLPGQGHQKRLPGNGRVLVGTAGSFRALNQAIANQVKTGQPVVISAAPNFRADPFAPYGGVIKIPAPPKPRVDSFVPVYNIYVQKATEVASNAGPGYGNYPGGQGMEGRGGPNMNGQGPASDVTLSGVMLGNGAYALVNADNNSLVLQPGQDIPGGGGQLVKIESDSISVKTTDGQIVKIPITTGQTNDGGYGGPGQGYPGAGGYGGPPQGYQGGPGNYPQQGPRGYRQTQGAPYPQQGYQGGNYPQ